MSNIIVPPQIVRYAHESLCRQLGDAAADIGVITSAGGCECGERYAEPVERFDRNRRLLDRIGWTYSENQGAVTISAPRDRATLRQALRAQLELERDMLEEDPRTVGGKQQIEKSKRCAQEIEQFLSELRTETRRDT